MAVICTIDRNNVRGDEIAGAIDNIRDGIATLRKFDGMRAETIAVSATEFGTVFGVTAEPQALSDRWVAITSLDTPILNNLLDAIVAD